MKIDTLLILLSSTAIMWLPKSEAATVINSAVSIADANVVQNGSFSIRNGVSFPGWNVSGGLMWSGYNGVNGGAFVGIGGYFSQTLTTQPGQTYLLQFYTTTDVPGIGQGGPYGLSVTWDSEAPISYTSAQESYNWVAKNLQFTAQSSQTLLTFSRIHGAAPYLDDVSVVPIPEPGSVPLLLLAVALLMVWRLPRSNPSRASAPVTPLRQCRATG
jgi:hypothetical protein